MNPPGAPPRYGCKRDGAGVQGGVAGFALGPDAPDHPPAGSVEHAAGVGVIDATATQAADASRTAPRHHHARAALAGIGLPDDRQARLAARRAFVNLKLSYLAVVETLPGPRGDWLRFQIRHAAEPADLWLLRSAVFDALPGHAHRAERDSLQRGIDSMFPRSGACSGFAPLF